MTPGTPAWACRCPNCIAHDAIALLEGARLGMALTVLRGLHESITVAVEAAYVQGLADGGRAGTKRKRAARAGTVNRSTAGPENGGSVQPVLPVPAFNRDAEELREFCGVFGADRVAEALGVALDDLEPLLVGRVAPPASGLRKLRGKR